ncbi:hypothetical protein [Nocardia sp. NPDC050710]|uniref:hypothetical protein n=1 Tax=Nocardia sp. NPDC050710 TaxID=3157220 RepID=UPI0033C2C65B
MGSEGDAKDNESDQSGSGFGPPLGEFGPPVGDFGPSVGEFGPPTGEFGPPVGDFGGPPMAESGPQWTVPEPPGDHPELGWRPADEPAVPPPPPQYRAPDTTVFPDPPRSPVPPSDFDATVRHHTPPAGSDRWWSPTDTGEVPKPPPEPRRSEPGLSWADDPIAKRLAPSAPVAAPSGSRSGTGRRWIVLGVVAALVVVAAIGLVIVLAARDSGGDTEQVASAAPTSAVSSCPSSVEGSVTTGNGPGDTSSGEKAILGFQHAYYTDRNGALARSFVAPDANVEPSEDLQRTIDQQIPKGTTYCLRITLLAPDRFNVVVNEQRPGGTTFTYFQLIQTVNLDGRYLVQVIGSF